MGLKLALLPHIAQANSRFGRLFLPGKVVISTECCGGFCIKSGSEAEAEEVHAGADAGREGQGAGRRHNNMNPPQKSFVGRLLIVHSKECWWS